MGIIEGKTPLSGAKYSGYNIRKSQLHYEITKSQLPHIKVPVPRCGSQLYLASPLPAQGNGYPDRMRGVPSPKTAPDLPLHQVKGAEPHPAIANAKSSDLVDSWIMGVGAQCYTTSRISLFSSTLLTESSRPPPIPLKIVYHFHI